MKNHTILFLICMAASGAASAQLYKTVSASGKVVYSDRPSDVRVNSVSVLGSVAQPERPTDADGSPVVRRAGGKTSSIAAAGGTLHTADRAAGNGKLDRIDVQIDVSTGKAMAIAGPVARASTGLRSN